jgi:genome maintenance exonuclease 1
MFIHVPPIDLITYPRVDVDGKRHYQIDHNCYPSITTILSFQDSSWLDDWRNRIGEKEATRITRNSSQRGTNLHQMCEDYLNNNPLSCKMPDALEMFYSIKPILNRINNIHFQEACLYSDKLQVAGTVDAIGEFDRVLSVIDFKNSRRTKTEDKIFNYFLQETFYSLAYTELSGISIPQIVTIIAVEDDKPQVFIKNIRQYIKPLVDLRKSFSKI